MNGSSRPSRLRIDSPRKNACLMRSTMSPPKGSGSDTISPNHSSALTALRRVVDGFTCLLIPPDEVVRCCVDPTCSEVTHPVPVGLPAIRGLSGASYCCVPHL